MHLKDALNLMRTIDAGVSAADWEAIVATVDGLSFYVVVICPDTFDQGTAYELRDPVLGEQWLEEMKR